MIIALMVFILSLILLTWGAHIFLDGAINCAKFWGISPILLGLTVVSISTSAPEIFVSVSAATLGHLDLAVGNAIGSNISNLSLVLGCTALIMPISVNRSLISRELILLFAITLVSGICLIDSNLNRINSGILIGILFITLFLMYQWQKKTMSQTLPQEAQESLKKELSIRKAWFYLLVGLTLLLTSSQALVWSASNIALKFGVSELVIGLTIVALGTSLPELAATLVSALRKQHDIAIGNIIGSNIFNLLIALPAAGMIAPGNISSSIITRDYPVMLILTAVIGLLIIPRSTKKINRVFGAALFINYIIYGYILYRAG